MLFVTIEDMSGGWSFWFFPKPETTQSNLAGKRHCLRGWKTPKEEGDNKIFVENVYLLTPENVEATARQLSLAAPASVAPISVEEAGLHLELTSAEVKEYAARMKSLFGENPGDTPVFLHVGDKTIRAAAKVVWTPEMRTAVEVLWVRRGRGLLQLIDGLQARMFMDSFDRFGEGLCSRYYVMIAQVCVVKGNRIGRDKSANG